MGEVYEATQLALDRRVAIKVIGGRFVVGPADLKRFEREARTAAALNHPAVVQVFDFAQDQGRQFLVMEFVEGEDLGSYVRRTGKLSVADSLFVIEQAITALAAALDKSIVHRDIKPQNLMRTTNGRIKVADLGLAKILSEDSDLTLSGAGMGSPHFMAPEQAKDARSVDHRADIYSLGITLLYLLTGKPPFRGVATST